MSALQHLLGRLLNGAEPCKRNPQCSQGNDCDCGGPIYDEEATRSMQMLAWLILALTFGAPLAVWVYWSYLA